MASVSVTINSNTPADFAARMERIKPFAKRIHVDLSDGVFTDNKTIGAAQVYDWDGVTMDLHLMLEHPMSQIETVISLNPSLVVCHYESADDLAAIFEQLQSVGIKVGMAIKPDTTIEQVADWLPKIDHLLVFTGAVLGPNGGEFQLDLLEKVGAARALKTDLEIAVDGGINQSTARLAIDGGADVLNVGSFVHDAEDPEMAYEAIRAIAEGVTS
jgi:ribulose-phosphate 3-epimerase